MTIKEYVALRKEEIKNLVAGLERKPCIAQVNEDAASCAYVRGKLKDADELGIKADLIKLPLETTQEQLLKVIDELNKDDIHDGFIVQMPLPIKKMSMVSIHYPLLFHVPQKVLLTIYILKRFLCKERMLWLLDVVISSVNQWQSSFLKRI